MYIPIYLKYRKYLLKIVKNPKYYVYIYSIRVQHFFGEKLSKILNHFYFLLIIILTDKYSYCVKKEMTNFLDKV